MKEKKRYQIKKLTPEVIDSIEAQAAEQAEVIVSANYFVVDVKMELENGRWYLRVYLDHPNEAIKISLEDCADISEALTPMIEDNIPELKDFPYIFEVSSPGLFRELRLPREFQFYQGRRIEIKPKGETAFIAYIKSFDRAENALNYTLTQDADSEITSLPWDPKKLAVSLHPDLTKPVEPKEVIRRIRRDD